MTEVTKQLAGIQDLLLGTQETVQTRAGTDVPVSGLSGETLPFGSAGSTPVSHLIVPAVSALHEGRVLFDRARIYGNPTPLTGNIVSSLADNPVGGTEITIFHESATPPNFDMLTPATVSWFKQGSGDYIPNTVNMIIARFLFGGRVDYVIVPSDGV